MQLPSHLSALGWALLVSIVFAMALARPVIRWIVKIGWVDAPNFRKHHDGRIPLAGGLIVLSACAGSFVLLGVWHWPSWQLWLSCLLIFMVSFFDDRFPIRARFRFFVQIAAAAIACTGEILLLDLGRPIGPWKIELGLLAVPFTIVGLAALTNAFNMIDGLDGLAGGVVAIALGWLAIGLLLIEPHVSGDQATAALETARAAAVIVGALVVFLGYNMRGPWRAKAAIFMGDGGSMMLGFVVASFAVYCASGFGDRGIPPIAIAWVVALPVLDLLACMTRRVVFDGVTPMTADRKHMHHLLLALGLPVSKAVPLLHLAALSLGAAGIVGWQMGVPEWMLGVGLVMLFLGYFSLSMMAWFRIDARLGKPVGRAAARAARAARVKAPRPVRVAKAAVEVDGPVSAQRD